MRRFLTLSVPVTCMFVIGVLWLSLAQQNASGHPVPEASKEKQLKIVPLVQLKPGETKELLLTTWCTVDITRGGGFELMEIQDGTPRGEGTKSFRRDGVTITVPSFDEGEAFANLPEFSLLQKGQVVAFKVTVTASAEAKAGFLEMHLVDATCSGHCHTDFRVLINKP